MTIDYEKLFSLIRHMMDYYSIPGMALGIITPGEVHTEGFGIRDGAGHPFCRTPSAALAPAASP